MSKVNPELKPGDRIMLIHMEDPYPSVTPTDTGTVVKKISLLGVDGYEINWDNGSKLSIWNDVDIWRKEKNKIQEHYGDDYIISNLDVVGFYNILFFHKYLETLRKTGIVNMLSASPYLYIGKRRLASELDSTDAEITPEIQNLLDLADEAQARMVKGAIKRLEEEKKVVDVTNINRMVKKDATTILGLFISHH
jgi:hypothetical protein